MRRRSIANGRPAAGIGARPGSGNIDREVGVLIRYRNKPFVLLALLALLVAQAAAGLHALRHLAPRGEPVGPPGSHALLCLECALFAPLAAVHGAAVTSPTVAALGAEVFTAVFDAITAELDPRHHFRSRAPPR